MALSADTIPTLTLPRWLAWGGFFSLASMFLICWVALSGDWGDGCWIEVLGDGCWSSYLKMGSAGDSTPWPPCSWSVRWPWRGFEMLGAEALWHLTFFERWRLYCLFCGGYILCFFLINCTSSKDFEAFFSRLWPWQGLYSSYLWIVTLARILKRLFFPILWPWQGLCCSYFWIIKRCTKYFMWALKTHILKDSWVYFSFLDIYASCKKYEFST